MIPHVFGSVSGRNVEARFTFTSTDERRLTEHVECEKVHADREYLDRQLCAVFAEAAMTPRSPRGRTCTRSGASVIQLVQTAFNAILRMLYCGHGLCSATRGIYWACVSQGRSVEHRNRRGSRDKRGSPHACMSRTREELYSNRKSSMSVVVVLLRC